MIELNTEQYEEEVCEYCKHRFYNGNVNTNQFNLCEGNRCGEAEAEYTENLKEENKLRLEYIIRDTIKYNEYEKNKK